MAATEASYYRARYYDPQAGRFTREDPLAFYGGDINLYRYVWNSSSNLVDPSGEWGVGVNLGGSAEAGVDAGVAGTGSIGGGVFFKGWSPSVGGFASGGAFIGGPGKLGSYSAPSGPGKDNSVFASFAGVGSISLPQMPKAYATLKARLGRTPLIWLRVLGANSPILSRPEFRW